MLSIVIPTYKEAQNVDLLLPQIYGTLLPAFPGLKVFLIDDDSNDGIEAVVEKHNKLCNGMVELKVRKDRRGLASAWREGILESSTALVGIMDADLAHNCEDLLRLVDQLKISTADMTIGSRYMPHRSPYMKGKSFLASFLSVLGQRLSRRLLNIDVYDMSHSLRVFRREVFEKTVPFLHCEGNAMMIEFTFHAANSGFRIAEIPITYGKRAYGQTKLGICKEGWKFLSVLCELRPLAANRPRT